MAVPRITSADLQRRMDAGRPPVAVDPCFDGSSNRNPGLPPVSLERISQTAARLSSGHERAAAE
jgi:hypothetical protein